MASLISFFSFKSVNYDRKNYFPSYIDCKISLFACLAAKDLIQRLLVVDTKRRFTAEQVLSHPWIQSEGTYKGPNLQREITMNLEKNFGDRNRRKALGVVH